MSTKVYNAFLFNGSLDELMSILYEIKADYYKRLEDKLPNLHFDNWKLEQKRYSFLPSDLTWKELKELQCPEYILESIFEKEAKINDYHPLNIEASVVIYFFENKIYAHFFGLDRDFEKEIFSKYTQFQDYHYQNNSDQSNYDWDDEPWEDMTEERQKELEDDWDERERVWDAILSDSAIPSDRGLCYDFNPKGYKLILLCNKILNSIK
jgi:hypothetical protein